MSIWDDPDLQIGGDFVKFDNVGDSITGRIDVIRRQKWEDGSMCPQILLTTPDGEQRTVTAGQIRLKMELATQRPEPGDDIFIKLSNVEKRQGGKTLKHFEVSVRRNQAQTPQFSAPAQQAAPPQQFQQAPVQAAPQFQQPPVQAAPQFAAPPAQDPWGQPPAQQQAPAFGGSDAGAPPF